MFPATSPAPRLIRLTRAQARTLAAVAISPNRREAGALLGRSRNTVNAHLKAAYEALHAGTLSEALWRVGWLLPPTGLLDLPAREPDGLVWIAGVE